MSDFILHSIACVCIDYAEKGNGKNISFPVCSEVSDQGEVVRHVAQCYNCGNVHLVEGFCKSRLQGKDETASLPNIEELELEVPERVGRLLKVNKCPLYVWQAANYIFKFGLFPNCIILSQEEQVESGKEFPSIITKMLVVNDMDKFEIINDKSDPLGIASPA